MFESIVVKAGPKAYEIIKSEGLNSNRIKVIAGAAGGPRWLVLTGLDKVIFSTMFKNRIDPLFLIGASIGTWRFAAAAQKNPLSAIEKFEKAYLAQVYSKRPGYEEVSYECYKGLDAFFNKNSIKEILNHPYLRLNILTNRSKMFSASDNKVVLGAHLIMAALINIINANGMKMFFERNVFYDKRDTMPLLNNENIKIKKNVLNEHNFRKAIMASGSIPMFMPGVDNIHGTMPGVYRDGGLLDYHLDIPFLEKEDDNNLVLYPHFFDKIIPGWFDKKLKNRKPKKDNISNVVLISPSQQFVESLPFGKIPDRIDFKTFQGNEKERNKYWNKVIKENMRLGEEFWDAVQSKKIKDIVQPLDSN